MTRQLQKQHTGIALYQTLGGKFTKLNLYSQCCSMMDIVPGAGNKAELLFNQSPVSNSPFAIFLGQHPDCCTGGLVAVCSMAASSHTVLKFIWTCVSWQMNRIASECKHTQDIAVNNSYPWAQYFTSLPNQLEREAGAFLIVEELKYQCFCAEFMLHHSLSLSLDISAHQRCTDIYLLKSITPRLSMEAAPL